LNARRRRSSALLALAVALAAPGVASVTTAETIELPRSVPSFNQNYTDGPGAWGGCSLGTAGCPDQVSTTGCLVTAFASVLAYYDVAVSVSAEDSCTGRAQAGMDPGVLNDWLRANGGYGRCAQDPAGNCCLAWSRLPDEIELAFHTNRSDVGLNPVAAVVIDHALRQGHPVVAGVHWGLFCHGSAEQTEDCHWVVLTGKAGETYLIIDPYNADATSARGIRTTLAAGVHGSYVIDRFVVVSSTAQPRTDDPAGDGDTSQQIPQSERDPVGAFAVLVVALATLAIVVFALQRSAAGAK
jgi:hypothetical protein